MWETSKPIDRVLTLFGIAMGITFSLIPKRPIAIIIYLITMFVLLIHPLWKFWWIEKSRNRQMIASFLLVACLLLIGRVAWPPSVLSRVQTPDVKSIPPEQASSKEIRANPKTDRPSPKTATFETDKHAEKTVERVTKEIVRKNESGIEELIQREITFEQREEIAKELKTHPAQIVYVIRIDDNKEASNYALEIASTLFAGGWKVNYMDYNTETLPSRYGIHCMADSITYPEFCDIVVLAFAKAGLLVATDSSLANTHHPPAILVGLKP